MIETQFETPFGTGRVLIYNDHSIRFWADKGSNCTLVINGVELTVDLTFGKKDDGTWDLGYYETPHYTNGQRREWRRSFPDIKRADWIHTDKVPSNAARDKVNDIIIPSFIKFIDTLGDMLAKAQRQDRLSEAHKIESQIVTKRAEIEKLLVELDFINRELGGRSSDICTHCYRPVDNCECSDQDVLPEGGAQ